MSPKLPHVGSDRMRPIHPLRVVVLGALCIVFTVIALNVGFWLCRREPPKPFPLELMPPDLRSCTRIEISYWPYVWGYPVWSDEAERSLLTPEEAQHIEMLLQFVVDDSERLSAFAQMIASGSYGGDQSGLPATKTVATVLGHFSDRAPMRLLLYNDVLLVSENKQRFHYKAPLGTLTKIGSQVQSSNLLPQIQLRMRCARNLDYILAGLRGFGEQAVYPSASTWCDAIVDRYLSQDEKERQVRKHLECPAVSAGSCSYAMNPSCRPDSPADTVLLFEIKGGWNQHGGPELFTFDNHEPRGGLVLLNDGTVKFIRTEEELKQLRWK
jgi:hypothetical protein